MTNARKNLKVLSILMLVLTAFTFARTIWEAFTMDFNLEALPEGTTAGAVLAAQIVLCVLSFIFLLPQIYVGAKGLKISQNPNRSKAHIMWAMILTVISAISIIFPVANLIRAGDLAENLLALLDLVTDVVVYIAYIVYAKQVLKDA